MNLQIFLSLNHYNVVVFGRIVTASYGVRHRYLQMLKLPDGRAETIEKALYSCLEG